MADVASSFKNWSASAASNNPTSATVIGSGLAPNLQQIQATLRTELGARSGGITAASTVDLNTVDEGTVLVNHVSGTVAISSFGTVGAGIKKLVTFNVTAGTLTLTYNATSMILPSAADITVSNGDSLTIESLGSGNWKVHSYSKADGKALKAFDVKNAANDSTFSSTSSTDAASPEWVRGYLGASSFGYNQTPTNFTSLRSLSTTYPNSTGKPLPIRILYSSTSGTSILSVSIDGGTAFPVACTAPSVGAAAVGYVVIPKGSTYNFTVSPGSPSIGQWVEG